MKKMLAAALVAATPFFSPLVTAADYEFDKVHTQILFSVSHLGFSTSTGAFVEFDGGFSFDPDNIADASVNVVIQTDSVDMNDATWNEHLHDKKWFDVETHPTMTFTSSGVTPTGEKTMDILGNLTIKGVTKPIVLNATLNKIGEAFGSERIGFDATATLDRSDFGVSNYLPAIPAEVQLRITVEGLKIKDAK